MTFATQMTTLSQVVELLNRLEVDTSEATTGVLDQITTLQDAISGERATDSHAAIKAWRALLATAMAAGASLDMLEPIIRQVLVDTTTTPEPQGSINAVWTDLYDYMHDNNESVKAFFDETGASLGTPSAGGSNVGNGDVVVLTVDENGYTLDGAFADSFTMKVDRDQRNLGIEGQERFRLEGLARAQDGLRITGTGLDQFVFSLDARSSTTLVTNPSFDDVTPVTDAAQPTALNGWTDETNGDFSSLEVETGDIYKSTPNAANDVAIRFTGDMVLSQDLVDVTGATFNPDVPYVCGFALRRDASATGTFTAQLGSVSRAITIGSESNGAYTWFWLVATPGQNNWFKNFNQNSLKLSFTTATLAVGTVVLDHIVLAPMTRFGAFGDARIGRGAMGHYMAIRSGTTPWVREDSFTFTYTAPTARSKNGYWLKRLGRGYLPNRADATQVVSSGGRTFTFADANPDTITMSSGDLTTEGYEVGMTLNVVSPLNTGSYTIAVVTATVITLDATDTLVAEGPISAGETLDATASVADQ